MLKLSKLTVIKIASMAASVAGMLGSAWVSGKENKIMLEKLVNEKLGK